MHMREACKILGQIFIKLHNGVIFLLLLQNDGATCKCCINNFCGVFSRFDTVPERARQTRAGSHISTTYRRMFSGNNTLVHEVS